MKILYKQSGSSDFFAQSGVQSCYCKYLSGERDAKTASVKEHYHNNFEIHLVLSMHQDYQIGPHLHQVHAGEFLLIPPGVKHCIADFPSRSAKISLTFSAAADSPFAFVSDVFHLQAGAQIMDGLSGILNESRFKSAFCARIIEGRIIEILILLLRLCGYREAAAPSSAEDDDMRILLARQFIRDNIELNLQVSDVADYCHISPKQLQRIFQGAGLPTLASYIQQQRIKYIETLLANGALSLKAISERMNFSNEYHFNSFFKKYAGMPPGAYRQMTRIKNGGT